MIKTLSWLKKLNVASLRGLFLASLLILCGIVWAGKSDVSHLTDSQCQECHIAADLNKPSAQARMLIGSQEKLCVRCHPTAVQLSHPSGFAPGRPLPETFPLDWKGDLTCSSCHHIHGATPGLLRGSVKGIDLCRACHSEEFFAKRSSREGAAHAPAPIKPLASATTLDDSSQKCLKCHDDKGGSTTDRVGINSKGVLRHMRSSLSHPIGRPYALSLLSGAYRPISALPSSIVLPDGKVECISCHENTGTGTQHGGLKINNLSSALCTSCHIR